MFRNNTRSEDCGTSSFSDKLKVYLPPLHMKLAFTKIFVKSTDKEHEDVAYLRKKLPK
jgi:hypothetical protein